MLAAPIEWAWGQTATAPSIVVESASKATAPTATLNAVIAPNGLDTRCQFEYVDDAAFMATGYSTATSVQCSPADLGSSFTDQGTSASVTGLTPGTTYHFRAVATNSAGTATGADTTFQESFKSEAVAHVAFVPNPNNFSLALDAAVYVYVGDATTSSVLRIAPRGDLQGVSDPPCVTEIISEAKALQEGQRSIQSTTPCPLPSSAPPGSPGFDFVGPKGIAVASNGTIYVTQTGGGPNLCDGVVGIFPPDGGIVELVNKYDLGLATSPTNPNGDWNPAGIAVDEGSASGVFVYATGPAPANGTTVRINPDRTFQKILAEGGQGLVVDSDTGNVYVALTSLDQVLEISDARSGVCGVDGKECAPFIIGNATLGCDGRPITLLGPYGLALAGGILYVTGQDSNNVLRRPLRPDNALGLPLCVEEIFSDGTAGLTLQEPRAIAADSSGNVYVAGALSNNIIWIRPAAADKTQVIPQEILNSAGSALNKPEAVAVDSQGNAYVSANLNAVGTASVHRIRTVTADLNPLCGNGRLDKGEACDYSLDCCCSVACTIQNEGTVCRGSSGLCDVTNVCNGTSPTCSDQFRAAGIVCRPTNGVCDRNTCTGTGPDCPDVVVPATDHSVCRPAANSCDLPEECNGLSPACPPDAHVQSGTPCVLPSSSYDPACSSSACNESGICAVTFKPDSQQCGDFCANTVCDQGRCVPKPGGYPCAGGPTHCTTANVGHECDLCGNGLIDGPEEECDAGPALKSGPTEGCTTYCQGMCDTLRLCPQPFVPTSFPTNSPVVDPCRRATCTPLSPASLGSVCELQSLGCTGCLDDSGCQTSDDCSYCDTTNHECVAQAGFKYYTCAFDSPLKFDMCPSRMRVVNERLKEVRHRHARAIKLTKEAMATCPRDLKESHALLQSAKGQLEAAIVEIVVLGFGRGGRLSPCVDEVSSQLELRAGRIRERLRLKDVRDACEERAFASELLDPNPGVPER